jgi:hypothetical protein
MYRLIIAYRAKGTVSSVAPRAMGRRKDAFALDAKRERLIASAIHESIVMSGRRSLIKGYFWRCAGRGCGHIFGLSRGQLDPLALMLSADPLPSSR